MELELQCDGWLAILVSLVIHPDTLASLSSLSFSLLSLSLRLLTVHSFNTSCVREERPVKTPGGSSAHALLHPAPGSQSPFCSDERVRKQSE